MVLGGSAGGVGDLLGEQLVEERLELGDKRGDLLGRCHSSLRKV
ncbi:hypothetical protein [Streptosporangium sp. NPDC049046]